MLQWAESTFDPIPSDTDAARAYGIIYALVLDLGRQPRKRLADLLIASVAAANALPPERSRAPPKQEPRSRTTAHAPESVLTYEAA